MTRRRNTTTLGAAVVSALSSLAMIVGGCASGGAPQHASSVEMTPGAGGTGGVLYASQETIGAQIARIVPPLKTQRFSTLLDFENDTDRVFVTAMPAAPQMVFDRAHTGHRALHVDAGTRRVSIKLSSLLAGRSFPGEWTLLGAFLYCDEPTEVTLSVENAGFDVPPRKLMLPPRTWTTALVDISTSAISAEASAAPNATFVIALPSGSSGVWCDDVMLVNNRQPLVNPGENGAAAAVAAQSGDAPPAPTTAPAAGFASPWSLQRRGLSYVGAVPGKFSFSLLTSEATATGWNLEEANELRARFSSRGGKNQSLTVYSDGRSYWDGQYKPISAEARNAIFAEEHAAPAEVTVPEEPGRLNRDTAGDANNDGYNELRGAYQVAAHGSRVEVKLTPHTRALLRPIIEIGGLSAGRVLVTSEGRLVEKTVRLEDGTLLVEIPTVIDRPTTINIRTQ